MIFTSAHKNGKEARRPLGGGSRPVSKGVRVLAVVFWLLLWQLGATALGLRLLLPSPGEVLACLARLVVTTGFWRSVGWSAARILSGFLIACVGGTVLAGLSARFWTIRVLLSPLVTAVKAVPVVSFIILALMWMSSRRLSLFISVLMVFPTVYLNLLEGVDHTDRGLLEMARVFRVPLARRLRDIYLPQALPWFRSACSLGLGLCWKSGVAAEVIGLPSGSVGERLYTAKIYWEMPELFAWTVTIVAVSAAFEKLVLRLLDRFGAKEAKP
ncbi:putative ABC transporter permease protein [Oscillibacter valericigenes Sjm18-20]|nr:putative ABC transporter permease protein [Oscillibacter valericigenes Sjm18-20]